MLPLRCKLNAGNRDLAEAVRWPAHAPELQRFRFQLAMDDKKLQGLYAAIRPSRLSEQVVHEIYLSTLSNVSDVPKQTETRAYNYLCAQSNNCATLLDFRVPMDMEHIKLVFHQNQNHL